VLNSQAIYVEYTVTCGSLLQMSDYITEMITERFCKKKFYWKFRKCDLTEFVGKVHSIMS